MRKPIADDQDELPDQQEEPHIDDALLERLVAVEERGAHGGQEHADEHPHEARREEPLARRARDPDLVAQGVGDDRRPRALGLATRLGSAEGILDRWDARWTLPFHGRPCRRTLAISLRPRVE